MANALTINGNGRCRSLTAIDLSSAASLVSIEIEGVFPTDLPNNQPLVAQWEGDQSSDNCFIFRVETTGELRTSISQDGNHVTTDVFDSTEPLPRPVKALRVEIRLNTQEVRYYYGDAIGGTFTQLGLARTATGVTSMRSSGLQWDIGYTHNTAPTWTTVAAVKRMRVTIDGTTTLADVDFNTAHEGDTAVVDSTGKVWQWSDTAAIWNVTDNLGLAKPRTGPGLALLGNTGDFFSTPDTAVLDITGDIDVRGYINPDVWIPGNVINQVIAAKRDTSSVQESWQFWINPEGRLGWAWWDALQVLKVISGPVIPDVTGVKNGQPPALRVTLRVSDGRVQMFYAPTLAGPWTLMHEDSTAGATSIFASTAPLEVGSQSNGTTDLYTGMIYEVEVRNGIGGTLVANPNFAAEEPGTISFTDSTGLLWTRNGFARITGDITARLWAGNAGSVVGDIWDYNQTMLEKFIGTRGWTNWDPTPTLWSSLGAGTATGKFIRLPGDVIMAYGRATLGSGGSITTGTMHVALPVDVDYEFLVQGDIVGQAQAFDASSTPGKQTGACYLMNDNTIRFVNESAVGAQFWSATSFPFFWTVSDSLAFNVIYKGVPG